MLNTYFILLHLAHKIKIVHFNGASMRWPTSCFCLCKRLKLVLSGGPLYTKGSRPERQCWFLRIIPPRSQCSNTHVSRALLVVRRTTELLIHPEYQALVNVNVNKASLESNSGIELWEAFHVWKQPIRGIVLASNFKIKAPVAQAQFRDNKPQREFICDKWKS